MLLKLLLKFNLEWNVYLKWAQRLTEKLHRKGDLEKDQNKAISINCNRESDKIEDMQIRFLELIIEPTFKVLSEILLGYDITARKNKLI